MAEEIKPKETTEESTEETTLESPWYVFCSTGCGFCKKAEPLIEELNKEGHNILKLDISEGDNAKLNQELKKEFDVQCGTPWFINAETGKGICGFREKDVLEKWLAGEDIPAPPRPKGPPPVPPTDWNDTKTVDKWKQGYEEWRKENDHMPNLPDVETTIQRLKVQQERQAQMAQQQGAGSDPQLNNRLQVLEGKINIVENKLDQIIQKLGA